MRVSTGMMFNAGVNTINSQTAKMLHLQQQVATGQRIVTPSDDPVAAARALELTQASDVVSQYSKNRDSAQNALGIQETQLAGVGELITRVRELAINGGNGSLTQDNRKTITTELRSRFEELLGYANARDGNGKYIFSGYMGDTRPFSGSVETGAVYHGDDGQRQLQVSPSRVLEISNSGKDVFQRIRDGNGSFVTGVNATNTDTGTANTGTGIIDGGTITDPTRWDAATNSGNYEIRFWNDSNAQISQPGKTYYDIVDTTDPSNPVSVFTGGTPDSDPTSAGFSFSNEYVSGQAIQLIGSGNISLGANVIVNGDPSSGDVFTIKPSTTQDIFTTLGNLISDLEQSTANDAQHALLSNRIGFALTNLDQAEQNVLRVRAQVGARLQEVGSLQSINEDIKVQYQQAISDLQDLDYAKSISDLTRKQTDLQAAQISFSQITKLSLFNYI